jgi:hypothetical protein
VSEALRLLFAEIGFDIDEAALTKADELVRGLASTIKALIPAADSGAAGIGGAARKAGDDAKKAAEDAAKATKKEADAVVQAEAAKKKARDAPGEAARKAREDHGHQRAFDASAAGQEHAAWKRLAELEDAAKKPVTGLVDLLGKFQTKTSTAVGRVLPASFQKLAQRMGVAKGDFAAMGQIAVAAVGATIAIVTRGAAAVIAFADSFAQNSEALRETARESRITSQELQQFQHAGAQSGVGAERMAAGVAHLATNLRSAEMRMGGGGVGGTLRRLGVDLRDSSGRVRATSDVMDDLALAFERVPSPIHRARMAQQLFGESGRRMLDVLHSGPGGLRALREEMEQLGGGVTPEATEAARQYTMAQERLGRAGDSLRSVLATGLLPVLSWLTTKAAELGGWWARLTRGTHLVEVGMIALGATAAVVALSTIGVWGPVVGPFLAAAAAAAALGLVFDDLWTFVEGGDSALGRFVDSMFGVGTSSQYAHELREEWEAVQNAIAGAIAKLAEWTGIGEVPSLGTLTPPRTDGRPNAPTGRAGRTGARTPRPSTPSAPAAPPGAPAGAGITVPVARMVAAPAGAGNRGTVVHRRTTVAPGAFVFHGVTDPEAVGRVVRRELATLNGQQNDGDHAVDDGDDS